MKIQKINLFFILLSPLMAIIFGVFVAYHNELSILPFTSNLIGVFLGIPISILIACELKNKFVQNIIFVASLGLILIGSSFLFPGVNDIHRWVFVGSIPLNMSMIIIPLMLYIISKLISQRKYFALLLFTSIEFILVIQPDAGQTTSFGFGSIILFLLARNLSYLDGLFVFIIFAMSIIFAWYQPDALSAVKQVELILRLAITMGLLGILGIILTIFILIFPIFLAIKQKLKINYDDGILAITYIIYFLTQLVVTSFGNFPVPIIGAGAAPVLGWYLILGFLINKSYLSLFGHSE
ncbi:hypothetical protein [Legionella gresilensis]|uniref:hypothetical protein n=1 Tax=Legionella gresilensis TaxID=91823 RepID=UPI001041A70F|nr:hypothetical protein [Legionella gresilensis]